MSVLEVLAEARAEAETNFHVGVRAVAALELIESAEKKPEMKTKEDAHRFLDDLYQHAHPKVKAWGLEAHDYGQWAHSGKKLSGKIQAHRHGEAAAAHAKAAELARDPELSKGYNHAAVADWHDKLEKHHTDAATAALSGHRKAVRGEAFAPVESVLAEWKKAQSGHDLEDKQPTPAKSDKAFTASGTLLWGGGNADDPKEHRRVAGLHADAMHHLMNDTKLTPERRQHLMRHHIQAADGHARAIRYLSRKAEPDMAAEDMGDVHQAQSFGRTAQGRASKVKVKTSMSGLRQSTQDLQKAAAEPTRGSEVFDKLAQARKRLALGQRPMEGREPHMMPPGKELKSVSHYQRGQAWRFDRNLRKS